MSVRVLSKVLRDSDETLGRRLVLIALADAASDDGVCWLGQDEIAAKARLTRTHTARLLGELEEAGALDVRKAQRGRRRINVYRVLLPGLPDVDYDRLPFTIADPFAVCDIRTPSTGDGVRSTQRRCAIGADDGVRSAQPTRACKQELEPLEENRKGTSSRTREAETDPPAPVLFQVEEGGEPQNLGWNALAEVCGVDKSGNRAGEIAAALNGGKNVAVGIRALCWRELVPANRAPRWFEEYIARRIREQAVVYRSVMRDALLTPIALAKWWTDLDAAQRAAGGSVAPDELLRRGGVEL